MSLRATKPVKGVEGSVNPTFPTLYGRQLWAEAGPAARNKNDVGNVGLENRRQASVVLQEEKSMSFTTPHTNY